MSAPQRKRPQWLLDELAADPTLAEKLAVAKAEADKVAAEKVAREAEVKTKCVAWHASKPRWVVQRIQVAAGVPSRTEQGWEVEPKYADKEVLNKMKCPHCGKD
jgi:hypothetical protein